MVNVLQLRKTTADILVQDILIHNLRHFMHEHLIIDVLDELNCLGRRPPFFTMVHS